MARTIKFAHVQALRKKGLTRKKIAVQLKISEATLDRILAKGADHTVRLRKTNISATNGAKIKKAKAVIAAVSPLEAMLAELRRRGASKLIIDARTGEASYVYVVGDDA